MILFLKFSISISLFASLCKLADGGKSLMCTKCTEDQARSMNKNGDYLDKGCYSGDVLNKHVLCPDLCEWVIYKKKISLEDMQKSGETKKISHKPGAGFSKGCAAKKSDGEAGTCVVQKDKISCYCDTDMCNFFPPTCKMLEDFDKSVEEWDECTEDETSWNGIEMEVTSNKTKNSDGSSTYKTDYTWTSTQSFSYSGNSSSSSSSSKKGVSSSKSKSGGRSSAFRNSSMKGTKNSGKGSSISGREINNSTKKSGKGGGKNQGIQGSNSGGKKGGAGRSSKVSGGGGSDGDDEEDGSDGDDDDCCPCCLDTTLLEDVKGLLVEMREEVSILNESNEENGSTTTAPNPEDDY